MARQCSEHIRILIISRDDNALQSVLLLCCAVVGLGYRSAVPCGGVPEHVSCPTSSIWCVRDTPIFDVFDASERCADKVFVPDAGLAIVNSCRRWNAIRFYGRSQTTRKLYIAALWSIAFAISLGEARLRRSCRCDGLVSC